VVALLVFGPNRMPEIGRQLAKGLREFRRIQQHLTSEFQDVVSDLDITAEPRPRGGDPVPTLPPRPLANEPVAASNPDAQAHVPGSTGEPAPSPPPEPA
jgi:TatA/E family protein of Tat protein translocase